jgi:hypothetical protein
MFYSLYNLTSIDDSSGAQLDKIGKIVGQPRMGLTDIQYRLFLKGKISQNVSMGTNEDLYKTYENLTGASNIALQEYYPCYVEIWAPDNIPNNLEYYVKQLMDKASVAGVRFGGIRNIGGTGYFRFTGDDFYETSFDSATGWELEDNWTIAGGEAHHTAGLSGYLYNNSIAHVVGKKYLAKIDCKVTAPVGSNLTYCYGDSFLGTLIPNGTDGVVTIQYEAVGTAGIEFFCVPLTDAIIRSVKVFEYNNDGFSSLANPTIGGKFNYYIIT